MGNDWFDPNKRLHELTIFKVCCSIFIVIFFIVFIPIVYQAFFLDSDWSIEGIGLFFKEIVAIPIGVAASSIPVIALIASIHRSSQTKKQIEINLNQTSLTNYFRHLDDFEKYIEESISNNRLTGFYNVSNLRLLHKELWPGFKDGDIRYNEGLFKTIDDTFFKFYENLKLTQLAENSDIYFSAIYLQMITAHVYQLGLTPADKHLRDLCNETVFEIGENGGFGDPSELSYAAKSFIVKKSLSEYHCCPINFRT